MTAGDAAQHLEGIESDGFRLMRADQLPEILFATLKTGKRRLPRLAGLPLQKTQHPASIVAGLHAGAEETVIALGQASEQWRRELDERIEQLTLLRDRLNGCIGCGCLSMEACPLRNQGDVLGEQGPGPHFPKD